MGSPKKIVSGVVGAVLAMSLTGAAGAAELEGVTVPDSAQVGGQAISLNGVGLRKAFVFAEVYVAGLYLATPTHDAKVATETDERKRISMHFLREVTHVQMNQGMRDGFALTAPHSLEKEKAEFESFFTTPFQKGDVCDLDYVPGVGTTVSIDGEARGTIPGAAFMRALWGIWLGADPPGGTALKNGLLGIE